MAVVITRQQKLKFNGSCKNNSTSNGQHQGSDQATVECFSVRIKRIANGNPKNEEI